MKAKSLLILSFVTIIFSSCTTMKRTATTADVQTIIYQYPTVADLEVKNKIEVSKTWSFFPFHIGEPKLNTVKGNFIAEILKEQNADILLEPQFIFSKTSYGERKLTITGYPASFKNFRKASSEDLEALKITVPANKRKVYNVNKGGILNLFK